nr:retrovirus-related Pol polyprotein from transposon TNT 1-94 [Tanacetum cinerariifolium]
MESDHSLLFDDGKCIIKNKATNKNVALAYMTKNRMFPLDFSTDVVFMSKNLEESELWHLRYGHLNYRGLQLLKSKEMVANLPSIVHMKQVCDKCVLEKQTKMSFPVGKSKRATDLLELVHADLCGPIRTESLEGAKKQSGKDLKVLRTDRGGKFISKEFAALCDEEGIKRELTAPYTPEKNGVAERKNRTVVEMARSMLKSKELPDNFWAEGVAAVVYLLNISPTKSVWNMTPYKAWYGNKPSGIFLRDVVFDEQASWDWNDKVESLNNKRIEVEEISSKNTEEVSPVEEQSLTPTRSSSSSSLSTSFEGYSPHESMQTPATQLRRSQRGHIPRCRFPVEGELDNEDDDVTLLALFTGDPVTVKESLKHEV